MREPQSPEQKAHILIHDQGVGAPSPDSLRQRASELAVIAGRAASAFTDEDLHQARLELMQSPEPDEEAQEEADLPFEPGNGEILGSRPHQAPNFGSDDETSIGEELVREGLDEALHNEMLEARKINIRDAS